MTDDEYNRELESMEFMRRHRRFRRNLTDAVLAVACLAAIYVVFGMMPMPEQESPPPVSGAVTPLYLLDDAEPCTPIYSTTK